LKTIATTVAITLARTTCRSVTCRTRLNTPRLTSTPAPPTAPNLATSRQSRRSPVEPRSIASRLPSVGCVNPAMLTTRSRDLPADGWTTGPSDRRWAGRAAGPAGPDVRRTGRAGPDGTGHRAAADTLGR